MRGKKAIADAEPKDLDEDEAKAAAEKNVDQLTDKAEA
jgi:hypothetical protein